MSQQLVSGTTKLEANQLQAIIYAKSAIGYAEVAIERQGQALDQAIKAGEYLSKVKESIGHGNYLPWIEAKMPVNYRQCAKYTYLYENTNELEQAKHALGAHLDINQAVKAISKIKKGEPEVYKPTYSDHYLRVIAHIERVGGRVKADLLSYLLQTEEKNPDTDWRELIPQDPKDNPELCLAISKTIQRFTHPDMGGTTATSQRANVAHSKLKKAIQ